MRPAVYLGACAICGCTTTDAADTGIIAYSEDATGALVVAGVPSGEQIQVLTPSGSPGALSISPDQSQIAFSVEHQLFAREVFVADLRTGQIREVLPETGEQMPYFAWGGSDWFYYYLSAGGVSRTMVVPSGAAVARALGGASIDIANEAVSATEPRIAYTECSSGSGYTCPRQLVVESVDGMERSVVGMAPMIFTVAFTPDGLGVITYEEQVDGYHLVVRDAESGTATDLGPAEPSLAHSWQGGGASLLSPDGAEILTTRGGMLVAIRLDGGGSRVIADTAPTRAGFTARGDVLSETERNLSTSDVADLRYDLQLYDGSTRVDVLVDQQNCSSPWFVSPQGDYVAWTCGEGLSLFHLPDGGLVRTSDYAVSILGYDRDNRGIVTAEAAGSITDYRLYYTTHEGTRTIIGDAWYQDTPMGYAGWPPFSFVP